MDLSLIKHLSKECDVYYLLDLAPHSLKSSALHIQTQVNENKILNASVYSEFNFFDKYINLKNFSVINRLSSKTISWSNLRLQNELVQHINKIKPDIIHLCNFLFINHITILFKYRSKMILTVHDPFLHSGEMTLRKKVTRHLNFTLIKNLVLLNSAQKNDFLLKNNKYKFNEIHMSSLSIYEYLTEYTIEATKKKKFKILYFGRISPYKGIDILLEAFNEIEKNNLEIELIIAGAGKFYFDTTQYDRISNIKFLNRYIPNHELVNLIYQSTIVVCPYKDATQSGVVMSAFALNKPVIATNVGGMSEMIENGKTGFIVPPNNSKIIAEKILQIFESPDVLNKMEENIKDVFYNGNKSWKVIAKNLVKYYSNCKIKNTI